MEGVQALLPNARTRGAKTHVESALSKALVGALPVPSATPNSPPLPLPASPGPFTLVQPAAFSTFSSTFCFLLSSSVLHPKRLLVLFAVPRRLETKSNICSAAQPLPLIAHSNQRLPLTTSASRPTAYRRRLSRNSQASQRQT